MKLLKTELQTTFIDMHKDIRECLIEAFAQLNGLVEIDNVLVSEEEYVEKYGPVEYFDEFRLDKLEEYLELPSPNVLGALGKNLGAGTEVLNRRLQAFTMFQLKIFDAVDEASAAFIPLSDEDVARLKSNIKECLGNLATFMYYQFDMDKTIDSIVSNQDLVINVDLFNYLDSNGINIPSEVTRVKEILNKFRPSLPLFEEKPELEEPFYEIAGPYVQDFDVLEEFITLQDVMKVLSDPSVNIEAFIRNLEIQAQNHAEK